MWKPTPLNTSTWASADDGTYIRAPEATGADQFWVESWLLGVRFGWRGTKSIRHAARRMSESEKALYVCPTVRKEQAWNAGGRTERRRFVIWAQEAVRKTKNLQLSWDNKCIFQTTDTTTTEKIDSRSGTENDYVTNNYESTKTIEKLHERKIK
jgi:hypothetical protein